MLSLRDTRQAFADVLTPLYERYSVIFGGGKIQFTQALDTLTASLVGGHMTVVRACEVLEAIQPNPRFWRTDLGQALYGQSLGYRAMTRAEAQYVLGVSRQRVHQMIVEGILRQTVDALISQASLYEQWRERQAVIERAALSELSRLNQEMGTEQ